MGLQRGFPAPTSFMPSVSGKTALFGFVLFLKTGLEGVFAKRSLTPQVGWAGISPCWLLLLRAVPALCSHWVTGVQWTPAWVTYHRCLWLACIHGQPRVWDWFLGLEPETDREEREQGGAFTRGVWFTFIYVFLTESFVFDTVSAHSHIHQQTFSNVRQKLAAV